MSTEWLIRPIEPRDDVAVARLIRTVMPEFGASGPGFAINDPEVDTMTAAYARTGCAYWVVEFAGEVAGGGGIAPLDDGPADTCELRKMYFMPVLRGRGAGRALIERCLAFARDAGYRQCYLETLAGMHEAQRLYRASGFARIDGPMGATGHFACNTFFLRAL